MDPKTLQNLRDAGCCEELIEEYGRLPSTCARVCRLKRHRRALLECMHASQRQLEALDYLIHGLQHDPIDPHTRKERT